MTIPLNRLLMMQFAYPTYLPELKSSAWDDVTVEAAADMATGLDSTEHDEQPVDDRQWFALKLAAGGDTGAKAKS